MSFSGILDIAISLIFLYLLISLVCTSVNESIATVLKLRSRSLSVGIAKIIENEELKNRFYANGLVKGAISASQWKNEAEKGVPTKYEHSSYLDSKTFAMALLSSLNPDKPIQGISDIEESVNKANLPSGIKDVLASALSTGSKDMTALRDEVANWFDNSMDRLSGEYKRQLKWISFGVGLFLAILLNVDSVEVAKSLWTDQALRQQLATSAATFVDGKEELASCPVPTGDTQKPAADNAQPQPAANPSALADQVVSSLDCQLGRMNEALQNARPFPIGWTFAPPSDAVDQRRDATRHIMGVLTDPPLLFSKIVGWLFTAVALSLGAPFWFDTLSKFMNVRGAGTKPEKAQTAPTTK